MTLGTFDLLEGLDIFMFRTVHDGKDLRDELIFISGPLASGAGVKWFQRILSVFLDDYIHRESAFRTKTLN